MPLKKKRPNQEETETVAKEQPQEQPQEQPKKPTTEPVVEERAEDEESSGMSDYDETDSDLQDDEEQVAEEEDEEEDDDEDEEDGLEGTYDGNEEIQVDFEGRNPVDSDFPGIRQLLTQLLLRAPINLTELADLIIGQNYIGSVVTQCEDDNADRLAAQVAASYAQNDGIDVSGDAADDDDDLDEPNTVFGITTAINLTRKTTIPCVDQLRQHLLARCETAAASASGGADSKAVSTAREVLKGAGGKTVAFLLNERFVNIPPQISVPLLENLVEEVRAAAAKGMPYEIDYYVMLVKLYRTETAGKKKGQGKGQKKKKEAAAAAAAASAALGEAEFYTNAEEEAFVERALCSFEYSVKGESLEPLTEDEEAAGAVADGLAAAMAGSSGAPDDSGLVPCRKLVILEASQLPAVIEAIKAMIEA